MKKNLFLGMTLGMALLANTAFAHLSGGYLMRRERTRQSIL